MWASGESGSRADPTSSASLRRGRRWSSWTTSRPRARSRDIPSWRPRQGGLDELVRCDAVVKTPGISRYRDDVRHLGEQGVPVVGGLGLWLEEVDPSRVVCITGTKGKSTTAALCGHLLGRLGYDVLVGGNLGAPPYEVGAGTHDLYVVETSSFQATDVATSPPVVAVTALDPDHLDWHGDVETYYRDKLSLTTQPGAELTIAAEGPNLRAHERLLGPRRRWVAPDDPLGGPWVEALGLRGRHNLTNALVGRAVLQALGIPEADDEEAMAWAAEGFSGLESRLQTIATVAGVAFVDDSLATNVLPACEALAAYSGRRVALIAGGFDRGIDYAPLADALTGRDTPVMVSTLDRAGERVAAEIARHPRGDRVTVSSAQSMREAVEASWRWARPDGVVLLSPAAPSFGRFRDYRDRAAAFATAMREVTEGAR